MSITPFPHQIDALNDMKRIEAEACGGFLSHEMGLGKTITMALHLKQNKLSTPDLIVCPFSLLEIWKSELTRVHPDCAIFLYHGPIRRRQIGRQKWDYIITTYSILATNELETRTWGRIVLDESHCIKNGLAGKPPQCAKSAFRIAPQAMYRWCISGTPFNNRITDVASQCKFIGTAPYNEKDWWNRYKYNERRITEWREKFVLMKSKEGLIKPAEYHTKMIEPTSMESSLIKDLRAKVAKNFAEWRIAEGTAKAKIQMEIMSLIMRLRMYSDCFYCGEPEPNLEGAMENCSKLKAIVEDIDDWLAEDERKGLVIFSQFTSFISILKKCIEEYLVGINVYTFTGDMNSGDRDLIVKLFNKSRKPRVILVSLMAGGTGLSLHHGSSTVLMCEPCYNPFAEKQAEERVHRLGQENKVNVIRYRMTEGVESWMDGLKMKKMSIASSIGMAKKSEVNADFSFSDVEKLFSEHVSPTRI